VPKKKPSESQPDQFQRFKSLARELEADESPGALDRAFGRLDIEERAFEAEGQKEEINFYGLSLLRQISAAGRWDVK
jgi:hypothetical protein